MKFLTQKQERILSFIENFIDDHGFPPTLNDIGCAFGFAAQTASDHLNALIKKGYVHTVKGKSRGIKLIRAHKNTIPVLGKIAAGSPILAVENMEENIAIPPDFFTKEKSFALKVKGDSMQEACIADGDYAIIKVQDHAENADIVAVLLDDEVTLKYYIKHKDHLELRPANRDYSSIIIKAGDTEPRILGVMVGIVRRTKA